ncbi:galactokinase [Alysiella filiformis]|uniref:Galactokinase n=1 Tax=Alysiella filiformis DSM 16848 TaxID=1120981 RepID=A0A286E412_9NEIS|nr:galactokinase [Alysiella filiformis]QMT31020.1 galactokinase [Alysiella filiformis]UBQ55993.1 galactokinase [Alysiella filiformis DSM 16848]SOD65658.1 galactokinase [Alysiella filiformis DSM 16848]
MNLKEIFAKQFFRQPEFVVRAHGRVNLIGEHTDYNDGFVLPCAIDFYTDVALHRTDNTQVSVYAVDYDAFDEFDLRETISQSEKQWANYVRGVVWAFQHKGFDLKHGFQLAIHGNVPQGAGLSSSAALEVAIGKAIAQAFDLPINHADVAQIGQFAENEFVGCKCGIMDQLTSACGETDCAVLIDCRSLETQAIELPKNLSVMIVHSHVQRGLVGSEYNTRRQQCEMAAKHFGVEALRDVSLAEFDAGKAGLDAVAAKRARYIIQENQRTLDAAHALKNNDIKTLSRLMAESHIGMRDEFEITHPAVDVLVDLIGEIIGERGGVRMTGGGFGGCVVALLPHDLVDDVKAHLAQHYHAKTGLQEEVFVCTAHSGVAVL